MNKDNESKTYKGKAKHHFHDNEERYFPPLKHQPDVCSWLPPSSPQTQEPGRRRHSNTDNPWSNVDITPRMIVAVCVLQMLNSCFTKSDSHWRPWCARHFWNSEFAYKVSAQAFYNRCWSLKWHNGWRTWKVMTRGSSMSAATFWNGSVATIVLYELSNELIIL